MKERKGGSSNNPYSNISQRDYIGSNRYIFFYFPFLYLSDFSKGLIDKTIPHKNSSIRKITFSNFLGPQIDPTSPRTKISCFYFYRQYETVKKISFWREKKKRKEKKEETSYGFVYRVHRRIFAFHNALFQCRGNSLRKVNEREIAPRENPPLYICYALTPWLLNPFSISSSLSTLFPSLPVLFNDFSPISIE